MGVIPGAHPDAGAAFVLDTGGVPIADFVFGLKGVAGGGLITLRTNAGKVTSENIDGISYEKLSPGWTSDP